MRNNERYLAFHPAVPQAFLEVSDLRPQFISVARQFTPIDYRVILLSGDPDTSRQAKFILNLVPKFNAKIRTTST